VEMLPGTPRFALHPRLFRFRPVGAPEKDFSLLPLEATAGGGLLLTTFKSPNLLN